MRFGYVPLLSALAAIALYCGTLTFGFAYDDFWQIVRNPMVTDSARSYLEAAQAPTAPGNLYRPVVILSYKLNWRLAAGDPRYFHLVNILLYALVCFLTAHLVMGVLGRSALSASIALLFSVHPVHVEAVANVVGRAELLAMLFGLLHVLALKRFFDCKGSASLSLALSFATLCLAILSKESAVAFALLAPLLIYYTHSQRSALKSLVLSTSAALVAVAWRYMALKEGFFHGEAMLGFVPENPLASLSFGQRLFPAITILGSNLELCLMPLRLSADYSLMAGAFANRVYSLQGLAWFALLGVWCFALWKLRREHSSFFGLWFLLAFLPTSNILFPIGTVQAERLALVPSLGALGFSLAALPRIKVSSGALSRIGIAWLIAFGAICLMRIPVWRDNLTLFEATARQAPLSPKAAFNLGIELYARGQKQRAEEELRRALDLNPNHLPAARALADLLLETHDYGRVEYWYRRILQLDPNDQQVIEGMRKLSELKKDAAPRERANRPTR